MYSIVLLLQDFLCLKTLFGQAQRLTVRYRTPGLFSSTLFPLSSTITSTASSTHHPALCKALLHLPPISLKTSIHLSGSLLSLFSKGRLLKNWLVTPSRSRLIRKRGICLFACRSYSTLFELTQISSPPFRPPKLHNFRTYIIQWQIIKKSAEKYQIRPKKQGISIQPCLLMSPGEGLGTEWP